MKSSDAGMHMTDTIFSKIIAREIPADIVYEDDEVLAFKDIDPKAPVHLLVIPKAPIRSIASSAPADQALLGRLLLTCQKVAADAGLMESGFRVVTNSGREAGQTVDHLHFHVLGGRPLQWPPG